MSILQDMLVVPEALHEEIIQKAYMKRGYEADESLAAAQMASMATGHGIRTHGGLKALHLDDHLGSMLGKGGGGCVPGAKIEKLPSPYKTVEKWNCNFKLGQAVAKEAMETCMKLADEYGVGVVAVDNAFHYLWGGGYVMDAAKKGYIAYTNCPAALTEVVPFGGKVATLGTNPHSWGFPTVDAVGHPIVIDWATSVVAMGRVQQLKREGKSLPPNCAIDADGNSTTDPAKAVALQCFGAHKGYGMCLIDELYAAYIGGSTPTLRNRFDAADVPAGEKQGCTFFFQCIKPDAMSGDAFAHGRSQDANVKAVIADILQPGNERVLLPGQIEANGAKLCAEHGGLLFSAAECAELKGIADEVGVAFDPAALKAVRVPDPFAMAMAPKKRDIKILLTTTSYQDTPGKHHSVLEASGFEVVRARGPLDEKTMLQLVKDNGGFDGFLNGDDEITQQVLELALSSPRKLKVVAKYGIGLDSIDVPFCTAQEPKLPVLFTPGVNHTTVAEHCFMLMIGCAKHFWTHINSTKTGGWKRKTGIELAGKVVGIIGMGRIGKEVIKRAKAFGMTAIAFDVWWDDKFATEFDVKKAASMDEVIAACNVLSLHTNLDDSTRGMINAERIATMQPDSIIINTARGGLIDEAAVAEACKSGALYGYGGDVLCHEPMQSPHPFDGVDNVLLTPHVGSRTNESVERQAVRATTNIVQFLTGGKDFIQANKPRT